MHLRFLQILIHATIVLSIHAKMQNGGMRMNIQAMEVTHGEDWSAILGEYGSKYKLVRKKSLVEPQW